MVKVKFFDPANCEMAEVEFSNSIERERQVDLNLCRVDYGLFKLRLYGNFCHFT